MIPSDKADRRIEPADETELADAVREAAEEGTPLEIEGGGTRTFGRPVDALATLSTARLSGIVAYSPNEMVATVKAGTPLTELQAALDEANQRFVFEPIDHRALLGTEGEPTVGGMVAVNASGPRRFVAGACRDSLLGVRFVNGKGEIVKNGGRVMKNVTGLDLVKPMAGSFGTLGVLTEVTLKVQPKPETEANLAVRGLLEADAITVLAHAMATSNDVTGAAHLPELTAGKVLDSALGSEPATLMRLEGFESSVKERTEKLKALFGKLGEIETLDVERSQRLWSDIRDVKPFADHRQRPVWRLSMKPSEAHEAVMALRMEAGASAFYDWQGGLAWVRMEGGNTLSGLLRKTVEAHGGGHAMLIRATGSERRFAVPFQPQAKPLVTLEKRIREAFDPKGILNPGKMVA
ncbi:glycolate oxidase subunit GlcE [Notoacmeibacter marinus]|uniref:glycolate oxidase subunit GlcE n=1 Tax=Notoacmeibacter marinus TaxID=1876515 RepID=UPI000DF34DF5|nr:glycolate oxidase subunit GlcE [Notoacmeibacter marinus]